METGLYKSYTPDAAMSGNLYDPNKKYKCTMQDWEYTNCISAGSITKFVKFQIFITISQSKMTIPSLSNLYSIVKRLRMPSSNTCAQEINISNQISYIKLTWTVHMYSYTALQKF